MPGHTRETPRIYLVTGSTPEAEEHDRPEAYRFLTFLSDVLGRDFPDLPHRPIVCSDLWYLNQDHLRAEPAIAVGAPRVNALSAFLADKLPSLRVIDGQWIVQARPDFDPPLVACWGSSTKNTGTAVDVFLDDFANDYLEALVLRSESE